MSCSQSVVKRTIERDLADLQKKGILCREDGSKRLADNTLVAMTRFMIEHRITKPDDLFAFNYKGFKYDPALGDNDYPHFIRQ